MGDPGNPQHGSGSEPGSDPGSEPGPDQAGWAAPNPPNPPAPPAAAPPPPQPPPVAAPPPQSQPPQPQQWAAPTPAWGTPPPGGPVPPAPGGWQPTGAPLKKRRLTWLWILIPVLMILVASTIVVGVYLVRLAVEPIDATNEYLADISAGRYGEASDHLCGYARFGENDTLARQQQIDDDLGPITSWDITGFEFADDDSSNIIDVITTGTVVRSGITYDIRVGLNREDDQWKVCTAVER